MFGFVFSTFIPMRMPGQESYILFLVAGLIPWLAIADVLKAVLDRHDGTPADSVEAVIDADRRARAEATRELERRTST
jgi:1-deoxy-D-xylulose 5-phosphate reductoisomerase